MSIEANIPDKEFLKETEEVPDEEIPDEEAPDEETPDEEAPEESEEGVTATYNIENTPDNGHAYAAVGNYAQLHHHHVTNRYDHLQIILESKQSVHDELADGFRDIGDLIQQALAQVQQTKIVPQLQDEEEENTPLPATYHALSTWFYKLDEYEQCYVQAAAILHGTAASDISQYADEFYLLHRQQQQASNTTSQAPLPEELQASLLSLHNRSRRELHARTFTITQRIDGIERLYWRDVEIDGSSSFHLQVLDFLAGEYQSKGRHGKDALEKLGTWAQVNNAERFQCIARALGVFLWHQSKNALWQRANEWASNPSVMRWQRTAILLNAAHECDLLMYPEHAHNQGTSPTLQILAKWEVCAQKIASKADVYRGCAAANTYALIGKRQPDIALAGLAQLLLVEAENLVEIDKLQAAVISAYFTLSRSGNTYQTLCHLGTTAEQALLQPARPATARSRRIYRLQCQLRLKASLDAFFFIALDSLSNATRQYAASYQQAGSSSPSSQEKQACDRILAGTLTTDTTSPFYWHQEVVQILSIAIIERSSHASAFNLLFRWACALSEMKDVSSSSGKQLITSFQAFLVDLGHALQRKCLDLQHQNRLSPAFQLYTKQLVLWSQQKNTAARLFRQPAHQLNSIHQPAHA